ncbi:hypothetical protein [Pedobacter psychrodurus]|uniref:hypothetical protein n=1 Tax=Pedobacter psychrodurus TaxID=2530456 RepID=UPI002930AACC|nr:hypothetical protein [Pedobacter psychrodurus]
MFVSIGSSSFAQSNYFKMSYGFGGGMNRSYTDVYRGDLGKIVYGVFDYHMTPFLTVGLEGQYGRIKGGIKVKDPSGRRFVNKYTAVSANLKVMLGEFINYDKGGFLYNIRGVYLGFGLGAINNNLTNIARYRPTEAPSSDSRRFAGEDKSVNLVLPVNLGYNYYIKDSYGYMRYVINVNAQSNFTFGEGLDGYNESGLKSNNNYPDMYNSVTVGFRYMFGTVRSYHKNL